MSTTSIVLFATISRLLKPSLLIKFWNIIYFEAKINVNIIAKKVNNKMLLKLFLSTLYLSAFTFGGGYVIVSLMKKKFVDECGWIKEEEMLDLIAIAQSAPGPMAVNGAIVVGYKLAGLTGALVSLLGTILPPFIIISIVSVCYEAFRDNYFVSQMLEGMQAGVGAVITCVTYEMGAGIVHGKNRLSITIMLVSFVLSAFLQINVVYLILAGGFIGLIRGLIKKRRDGDDLS